MPDVPQVQTPQASVLAPHLRWRAGSAAPGERRLAEETPVALVHDGSTTAVMMATPQDIEDLAYGFAFTEGLIGGPDDVARAEVSTVLDGIEARLWLARTPSTALLARRRAIAGPTGCGLCGVDSLKEAVRPPRPVSPADFRLSPPAIVAAMEAMEARQALGAETRAVHAAALWSPTAGIVAVREDVGRHNALDKLAGALLRAALTARDGAVLLTSRVSVEMLQKAAAIGSPMIVAVSAPTALAVRTAREAGITLVAVARRDGFEVFTHPDRIAT